MRLNGKEISIHTGETFTLDFDIRNKDGSPYVIYSGLKNPYFLTAISDSKFKEQNRNVLNIWSIKSQWMPRFKSVRCVSITDPNYNSDYLNFNGWDTYGEPVLPVGITEIHSTFQRPITGGFQTVYFLGNFVYYYTDTYGNTTYRYFEYDSNLYTTGSWKEYNCKLIINCNQTETSEWVAGTYYYSVTLLAGEMMWTYLNQIASQLRLTPLPVWVDDDKSLYEYILANSDYKFPDDFDYTRALGSYSDVIPIIPPTTLTVLTSINGDI